MRTGLRDWSLLWRLRHLPGDLLAILLIVVAVDLLLLLSVPQQGLLRGALAIPFVLFCPGYALLAALFPEDGRPLTERNTSIRSIKNRVLPNRGIDGPERAVLSLGMSLAVSPLVGLLLNYTPWGIRLLPVVLAISLLTVGATLIGILRRQSLPEAERFAIPYRRWLGTPRAAISDPDAQIDVLLSAVVVLCVLLVASTVTYSAVADRGGERFTEFYLLGTNETGAPVANDYPTQFTVGQSKSLLVGIENQEERRMNYTVVVVLQWLDERSNETRVLGQRRLDRFSVTLAPGESIRRSRSVAPTRVGRDLRLTYLLYRGAAPRNPTVENAYREVHLFIDVSQEPGLERRSPPNRDG